MKTNIIKLFIIFTPFIVNAQEWSNTNIVLTNPSSYPYGININTTYPDGWAREFSFSHSGSGKVFSIGAYATGGSLNYGFIGGNSAGGYVYNIPWMVFMPNGNVGIGTTSPNAKLTIQSVERGLYSGLFIKDAGLNPRGAIYYADEGQDFVIDALSASGGLDASTFRIRTGQNDRLNITRDGNVGIGESNPFHKLTVQGVVSATEVKVSTTPNSDYVFEPEYNLRPIEEVESFIQKNKHLPDIPSAEEFKENGVGLGEMDDMLLRKVEELTLYVIQQKKRC